MWLRCVAFVVLCFALGGCVLQSPTPNFTEAEGVALPKAFGTRFEMESLVDGLWTKEKGTITLTAKGKQYVASNDAEKSTIEVEFVDLRKGWWVLQVAETGKPSNYVLAEAKGEMLMIHALSCDELKSQVELVRFEGSDCFLKGRVGVEVFRQFDVPEAKVRLVRVG